MNWYWSLKHLKKMLLKKSAPEATSSEARSSGASHQKLLHQKLKSVDKVQCTKCTTTNSAHASATTISASCLYIKTRITVMFADIVPSLVEWIWNWFFIGQSSNRAKDQWWIKASDKTSWCTGYFSTSLKSSIDRDEDLKKNNNTYTRKTHIVWAKNAASIYTSTT